MEAPQETIDRLRREVAELRASRTRLVLAADADRRKIECDLHEGVQQHLVAIAVGLQLARQAVGIDPAAHELLDELDRDVRLALDAATQLAQSIYPPLLEAGGLVVALRSAAASAGIPVSVDVAAGAGQGCPPALIAAVYRCCVDVFEAATPGAAVAVTVREQEGELVFELTGQGASGAGLEHLRDLVEALGGRLAIGSEPGLRVSGFLPLRR